MGLAVLYVLSLLLAQTAREMDAKKNEWKNEA